MKRRRKVLITGIILIFILILGIDYLMKDEGDDSDGLTRWISTKGSESITSISIYDNKDDQNLVFTKGKSSWKGNDGSSYDFNEFSKYITVFGYMKIEKKVNASPKDMEVYGLDKPAYKVSVSFDDGEIQEYRLGKSVKNLGLYFMAGDQSYVYLVDQQRGKIIQNMVTSLYDLALPDITFDEIRGITLLSTDGGTISLNRSEAPRTNGDFYWNLFKPYTWNADTKKIHSLIDEVRDICVLKRAKTTITAEDCGFGGSENQLPSIILYDNYDRELAIYAGKTQGEYTFCKINEQEDIFLIDKNILQIINTDLEEIIDTTFYYYEVSSVETCVILWQDESFELSAKWGIVNKDGKKGQRYYLDGNSITGAKYKSIADWFTETKVKRVGNPLDEQGRELGSAAVKRMSPPYEQTFIFRALPENDSLVQVECGQSVTVYIERKSVDNLISLLKH